MNLNQLKYIIAVDRYRNFSRAAEYADVAQSTLSKEIQRLEKEFDILIFDRTRQPVVPTLKGMDLIQQAKIILEEEAHFRTIARKKGNQPKGDFNLGVLSSLAPYFLPLFSQKINAQFPDLNLNIFEKTPQEMLIGFDEGKLDGAISITPFIKAGYYEKTLFEEEFVLYLPTDHPLAAFSVVPWGKVPQHELTFPKEMESYFKNQKPELLPDLLDKHPHFQYSSLETIRKMIDRNGGLTLIPKLACLYMGKRRLEMVRHIDSPTLSRGISFVTPRGFEKKRITKAILPEIVKSIPSEYRINLKKQTHL